MDSQRYINFACQQGYLSRSQLKKVRDEGSPGAAVSLWSRIKNSGLLTADQIRDVETACETGSLDGEMVIEGYRLGDRIGSGGMGDVYLGMPTADPDGPQVAIKMLPKRLCADAEHLQRFVRETRALAQIADAHFTSFIASGEYEARPYLIMELVRGISLKEQLQQKGALSQYHAAVILAQLSGALIKAEDQRMVHRDLKPANILLAPARPDHEEPLCAKICDFGLVKFLQDRAESMGADDTLTMSGIALGTPHYMSPEQATGERDIDHRSDMYSLAASLYHAMMGRTLFSGKTSAVIMYKQVTASIDVEPLHERGCHPQLVELLRDLLHKERDHRPLSWRDVYARATALLDIMEPDKAMAPGTDQAAPGAGLVDGGLLAPSSVTGMPLGIFYARRRALWGLAALFTAALLMLFALLLLLWPPGMASAILQASPENFPQVLAAARADLERAGESGGRVRRIYLQPGHYNHHIVLGPEHSGLHLHATQPGVVLNGGEEPAVHLQSGTSNIRLQGRMRLHSDGPRVVMVEQEGELELLQTRASGGALVVAGATLRVVDARLRVALEVLPGSQLEVRRSLLNVPHQGVRIDASAALFDSVRVVASDAHSGETMRFIASSIRAQALLLDGEKGSVGLYSQDCSLLELRQSRLRGGEVAWRSSHCVVPVAQGLALHARRLGLDWQGRFAAAWQWQNLAVTAEQSVQGMTLPAAQQGPGPEPSVLQQVPE